MPRGNFAVATCLDTAPEVSVDDGCTVLIYTLILGVYFFVFQSEIRFASEIIFDSEVHFVSEIAFGSDGCVFSTCYKKSIQH